MERLDVYVVTWLDHRNEGFLISGGASFRGPSQHLVAASSTRTGSRSPTHRPRKTRQASSVRTDCRYSPIFFQSQAPYMNMRINVRTLTGARCLSPVAMAASADLP